MVRKWISVTVWFVLSREPNLYAHHPIAGYFMSRIRVFAPMHRIHVHFDGITIKMSRCLLSRHTHRQNTWVIKNTDSSTRRARAGITDKARYASHNVTSGTTSC